MFLLHRCLTRVDGFADAAQLWGEKEEKKGEDKLIKHLLWL